MEMTLDEHIKKAEEDAAQAESDSDWGFGNYFIDRTEAVEYAENCRQLAEWLKDYKRLLERESCEEAISRAEAIRIASGYCHPANIAKELGKLPPVQPEQKTGHWIEVTNGRGGHECDVCHDYAPSFKNGDENLSAFCPNCGAKMEEGEQDD